MEELLGISQPNLSQHLSLLRHTGVVESEREGNQVCYRIKNEMVLKLLDALSQ
jgi:DNA-binding transcriptional ArsR family regulator